MRWFFCRPKHIIYMFKLIGKGKYSQFLRYESLLNLTYAAYKNAFSAKCNPGRIAIQWKHIKDKFDYQYTKSSCIPLGCNFLHFCTINDFGSPTICVQS